ncbi:hypothetical protein HK104_007516 [Borealophlyctis nickersoniae]|nr:hypothetical protein HK104_007516 [Borealophlyctis nickersoniae]
MPHVKKANAIVYNDNYSAVAALIYSGCKTDYVIPSTESMKSNKLRHKNQIEKSEGILLPSAHTKTLLQLKKTKKKGDSSKEVGVKGADTVKAPPKIARKGDAQEKDDTKGKSQADPELGGDDKETDEDSNQEEDEFEEEDAPGDQNSDTEKSDNGKSPQPKKKKADLSMSPSDEEVAQVMGSPKKPDKPRARKQLDRDNAGELVQGPPRKTHKRGGRTVTLSPHPVPAPAPQIKPVFTEEEKTVGGRRVLASGEIVPPGKTVKEFLAERAGTVDLATPGPADRPAAAQKKTKEKDQEGGSPQSSATSGPKKNPQVAADSPPAAEFGAGMHMTRSAAKALEESMRKNLELDPEKPDEGMQPD